MRENRKCQNCQKEFVIEPEDFDFYEKIKVPPPTWCPECRYQRRLAGRNEWNFYKRKCNLCQKEVVSIYNPDYTGPVYCQPCFWSDNWDPLDYGRDFDFSRPFFEQFGELRLQVPRIAITNFESVNSEYTNQAQQNKNCYLLVASGSNEDCLYGNWNQKNKDCVDCYNIEKCELVYESLNCVDCYRSAFLQNCSTCSFSYFLKDCRGCEFCFGCYGLRNKKYHFFNKPFSKEEYSKKFQNFQWTRENIINMRAKLKSLELNFPHKFYEGRNNLNFTGDYIEQNKIAINAFNCKHSEHIKHCQDAWDAKFCLDLTETLTDEWEYEIEGCAFGSRNMALAKCWRLFDSFYSELCFSSNNLFGCIALNKKQYCILNKQFSKEDYKKLLLKIIEYMQRTGEWGEFFPITISPFAYNETVAQDYFPLNKEKVLKRGFRWYERGLREYQVTIHSYELPPTIMEVKDDILDEVIGCESQENHQSQKAYVNCTTAFKIIEPELQFYRKMGLPLPHKCFHCRRQDRLNLRNRRRLYHRRCQCAGKTSSNGIYQNTIEHFHGKNPCPNEFETTYAPDRPEIVYCEACYLAEVV